MRLFNVNSEKADDVTYTKRVGIPQYTPSTHKPVIDSLFDYSKYTKLLKNIDLSSVQDDEKRFLKFAASRHIVFNYAKIADYYANASPEMQRLMEESALVILDVDDAIANGYIKLSSDIKNIMEKSGERPEDAK